MTGRFLPLLGIAVVVPLLVGCTPTGVSGQVREVNRFDSLPVLVATSDAIVVGTVIDVRTGRSVGGEEGGAAGTASGGAEVGFTDVRIGVEEVLRGDMGAEVELEVDDFIAGPDSTWRRAGERAVFFLVEKFDAPGKYRPVNTQAVYRLADDERLDPAGDDSFSASIAAPGLAALRPAIEAAEKLIDAGTVTPQPRGPRP